MGSKSATCMWIYTDKARTQGQIQGPSQEEYSKKRTVSIVICTDWACAGAFVDMNGHLKEQVSNMMCLLTSVARVLHRTHKKWGLVEELASVAAKCSSRLGLPFAPGQMMNDERSH